MHAAAAAAAPFLGFLFSGSFPICQLKIHAEWIDYCLTQDFERGICEKLSLWESKKMSTTSSDYHDSYDSY